MSKSRKDVEVSLVKSSKIQGQLVEKDRKTRLREIAKQNERIEARKAYKKTRYINERKKFAIVRLDELFLYAESRPNTSEREIRKLKRCYSKIKGQIEEAETLDEIRKIINSIPKPKQSETDSIDE